MFSWKMTATYLVSRSGPQCRNTMTCLRIPSVLTTFLGLLLFNLVSAQGPDGADQIIVTNRGLVVPLGRSVYVSPENLQLRVKSGDRCEVTVLDNDPLAQRPGRLMPSNFPCDFGPKDVVYSHFGARNPKFDVIRLQVRYDSFSETVLLPLTVSVEVSFKQLEVLNTNLPITVERLQGISSPIDDSNLEFEYNRGEEECKLSVLSPISGLPRYGKFVNNTETLQMVDCDQFLKMGVRYNHTATTNSPNKDYLPMVVEIIDADGRVTKKEHFQILVRILEGKENVRPSPDANAALQMEVDQFVMTAITPDFLAAEDVETPPELLIFNVTKPLNPGEGHFVSTDDRNQIITAFYQRDILDLKIAYKPPAQDADVKRKFLAEMEVIDSEGATSDPFMFEILVKPMKTLAPVVTTNTGIQLFEGQLRSLRQDKNLRVSDEDNLEDVKISVAQGVRHGTLLIPDGRRFFTAEDLRTGKVIYQHDGTESYSDNIIFRMNDGEDEVEFLFPIWVFPLDDKAPILKTNTILDISKNDFKEITTSHLSASDIDSDDSTIRYIIEPPFSNIGLVIMRQLQPPPEEDAGNWQLTEGVYEKIVDEFTQQDLEDGKIYYAHVGPHQSDVVIDQIMFRLMDSSDPPNVSDLKTFEVKISPVDDQLPYLYPNTTLQMDVNEFQVTEFRRKFMRFTDDDTDDREILYTVTSPPFDTDSNTPMESGYITLCEDRTTALATFTQAQVNHRKVCYHPPTEELGVIPRILQFEFDVEDTNRNILKNQHFTIILMPMDNQPPQVKNGGAKVLEGGFTALNSDMLDVDDPDTDKDALMFVIMEVPEHGHIKMMDDELKVGDFFTRNDILDGVIIYSNDGGNKEVGNDHFMIDISDGIHHVPVKFNVNVRSVDDERPALIGVKSEILKVVLEVQENSMVPLTAEQIRATDPDSDDMQLVFMVERPPFEGSILRVPDEVDEFTQADIAAGLIMYQHTGGEIGVNSREDFFELSLVDPNKELTVEGSRIDKVLVEVKIIPFDNEAPIVTIGEPFEVLESKKAPLLPRHLDATDVDTEDTDISCLVVRQPMNGYLENISPAPGSEKSRVGIPVSSFTIGEIRNENINYVQSVHKGSEPRRDGFKFHCSDGLNKSPDFRFDIIIFPSNDEVPEISLREFIVVEGGNLRIDLPIMNVVDLDEPADRIVFVITEQPKHGKIVRQTLEGSLRIQNFTLNDISGQSTIEYEHDDSETTEDGFAFYLIDGAHNISRKVPIKIFPLDDETPRLTINNGLQIDVAGDTKVITNKMLKADDLDSSDPDLLYFVRQKPKYGHLRKVIGDTVTNLTQGSNFTQNDIDRRRIEYVHTGIEGVRDLIKFDITDGLNSLIDRYFYVTIEGLDMMFPKVINKGVELPEGGMVVLTTDLLSGTDLNTPDETLTFTVTRAPGRGHLESSDSPGVPISTFTQLQLAGNKIRYVHDLRDEMKMDSFEFEVTDGYNPVTRTFRISLSDVDNRKPVLMFQNLRLEEGGNKLITPFELKADDSDTDPDRVVFTVTQVPLHGILLYNVSRTVTVFSQDDLNRNMISYRHDGSETEEDSFSFTVTDGTHMDFFVWPDTTTTTRRPQTVHIYILPVDNGIPQININRGASYLSELAGSRLGFRLTSRVLSTQDRDSPDDSLVYSITKEPRWGYIINSAIGNRSIANWTQGDINRHQIEYILKPSVNASNDNFNFNIADKGGNVLANQPFHLNWAWISLDTDTLKVNETDSILNVTLRRRGYLGETAFVTITAVNGTAKVGEDFTSKYAKQVQFNPGETEAVWHLRLYDDDRFEESETFDLRLSEPVMAVLEYPDVVHVTIHDEEDESQVFFSDSEYRVAEDIGEILIPIKRVGDIWGETMVICYTEEDTATGTVPSTVTSFSDYISRAYDHRSIVRFDKGDGEKFCRVTIIDDSLFEEEEKFSVILAEPTGGRLGKISSTDVFIEPDKNDEPAFYLGGSEYLVDESDGFIEIKVWRTGTDLSKQSSVTVRSRKDDPPTADAGLDYIAVNRILKFAPGVTMQTVRVEILDDLGRPRLEGEESFRIVLRMPNNAVLGEPKTATITINDSISDLPSMQFKEGSYSMKEDEGQVKAVIVRSGDIAHASSVRCFTRQTSARVSEDFVERPDTNASRVFFKPGDYAAECVVKLVDDRLYEEDEQFRLVLGSPESPDLASALVGRQNVTMVTIQDQGDEPVIGLAESRYTVKEPMFKEESAKLTIPVVRQGDLSQIEVVTINTKDGQANAGKDYNGFFKELVFEANVSRINVEVDILYDGEKENTEVFTVHLRSSSGIARIKNSKAKVYIEERTKVADVTFPDRPMVLSLRDYDNPEQADENPVQGYPLVCITTCNPKHPNYLKTGGLCESEGINNTLTLFRWRVSAPSGQDGVTSDLQDVESSTFFASTRGITLDSIYFAGGSRVQCGSRAVNLEGDPGLELLSAPVTVDPDAGICEPRIMDSVGAEPFTAKMRYTGGSDERHPNKVRLTITIPHRDGMMPVISTRQLSNFELTLSKDGTRLASHRCSNLLDFNEIQTEYGFITNETRDLNIIGEAEPYQYNTRLRSEPTLRFYRNLDIEACVWKFESYFDMSELMTACGGEINSDGQVLNIKQSYVSMRVPLYVSYVFHSPVARGGWLHYDMTSQLQLTFVYDTAILWQNGISSPESESGLQGYVYPTSMRIRDDGRLVVSFRTEARFRGQFVASHPGSTLESIVSSSDHPDLTFDLQLIRSDPTFDQPNQEWSFVSDLSIRDYSGMFSIQLIPCTTSLDQEYTQPISCSPREPLGFDLPIRFQQVSDPVPARFSLNTDFHLMRKREAWLSSDVMVGGEDSDVVFLPNDRIYGRISVDPVQDLGSSFDLSVEKVFLCSGKDGYIPKYDPDNLEFGCVAESPNLQYTFKILDKGAPFTVVDTFRDIPFDAKLAVDDPEALPMTKIPGTDGFSLACQPIFQVDSGRQWFLHTIYTVRSRQSSGRGIGKRSVDELEYHHAMLGADQLALGRDRTRRRKRSEADTVGMGKDGKGTNIARVQLDYLGKAQDGGDILLDTSISTSAEVPIIPILVAIIVVFIIASCCLFVFFFVRRRRKHASPPPSPAGTITVVKNGHVKVLGGANIVTYSDDRTEV